MAAIPGAQKSEATSPETPGAEKVIKVSIDGRGWNILKLIDFELEFYTKSNIGKGQFVVNEYSCQVIEPLFWKFHSVSVVECNTPILGNFCGSNFNRTDAMKLRNGITLVHWFLDLN
jgi:hypothetical protein